MDMTKRSLNLFISKFPTTQSCCVGKKITDVVLIKIYNREGKKERGRERER